MQDDLIRRGALIRFLESHGVLCGFAKYLIEHVPAYEPVPHGEWINGGKGTARCSVCNQVWCDACGKKYCPSCGAKMDGGRT